MGEGHRRRWGCWSQAPCRRQTQGQTIMAGMDMDSWGERHPRSRRISQAKAQKQELVVCRDWQAGWFGWGKGKRKLKTDLGYKRGSEWRLWNPRLTSLVYSYRGIFVFYFKGPTSKNIIKNNSHYKVRKLWNSIAVTLKRKCSML